MEEMKLHYKKILIYISTLAGGGAERMVSYLSNYLAEKGYNVILINDCKVVREYELSSRIKRYVILEDEKIKFLKKNLKIVKAVRKICVEEVPDVLLSFLPVADFRLIVAKMGLKIPLIFSVRANPEVQDKSRINRVLSKLLYPLAAGAVFQTKDAENYFSEIINGKGTVIANPVSKDFLEYSGEKTKRNIIAVGRLMKVKNHIMLIEAFSRISEKYKEQNLIIYGEGNYRRKLEEVICEKKLEGRVILPGYIADVKEKVCNAKIFVLSSDSEGMPNTLMEAMALGCPVISTDCPCGGPRSLIQDGENGLLVNVGDIEGLASAMERILDNEGLERKLRKNSRESMMKYETNRICLLWESYLEKVCLDYYKKTRN